MTERERDVVLTLTSSQYEQLGRDIKTLRRVTGAPSNTQAIVGAVRSEAERAIRRNAT